MRSILDPSAARQSAGNAMRVLGAVRPMMNNLRVVGANAFVAGFLLLICIDGLPSLGLFHDRARPWIQPILNATGISQGSWSIFTPTVDRFNEHLEAQIDYENGGSVHWRSPKWRELSAWEKLCRFREIEYIENLYSASNRPVRACFARFLADALQPAPGAVPLNIVVTYHSSMIAPPVEGDYQPLPAPDEHRNVSTLYVQGQAR